MVTPLRLTLVKIDAKSLIFPLVYLIIIFGSHNAHAQYDLKKCPQTGSFYEDKFHKSGNFDDMICLKLRSDESKDGSVKFLPFLYKDRLAKTSDRGLIGKGVFFCDQLQDEAALETCLARQSVGLEQVAAFMIKNNLQLERSHDELNECSDFVVGGRGYGSQEPRDWWQIGKCVGLPHKKAKSIYEECSFILTGQHLEVGTFPAMSAALANRTHERIEMCFRSKLP